MKLKFIYFFLLIFFIINCAGKNKNSDENKLVLLKETKKQFELYQWAVINQELPRLREAPSEDAKVINYLNIGTVVKILKIDEKISKFNNKNDYWYYIDYDGEKGWIFGTFLEIYNDYDEVMKRCEELLIIDKKNKEENKEKNKENNVK